MKNSVLIVVDELGKPQSKTQFISPTSQTKVILHKHSVFFGKALICDVNGTDTLLYSFCGISILVQLFLFSTDL